MPIEIDFPIDVAFDVFGSSVATGQTNEAPGGAVLTVIPGRLEKRNMTHDAAPVITAVVTFATSSISSVALSLFSSWLYDKIKSSKKAAHRRIRIKREWIEVTPEGIRNAVKESIEIDEG